MRAVLRYFFVDARCPCPHAAIRSYQVLRKFYDSGTFGESRKHMLQSKLSRDNRCPDMMQFFNWNDTAILMAWRKK